MMDGQLLYSESSIYFGYILAFSDFDHFEVFLFHLNFEIKYSKCILDYKGRCRQLNYNVIFGICCIIPYFPFGYRFKYKIMLLVLMLKVSVYGAKETLQKFQQLFLSVK